MGSESIPVRQRVCDAFWEDKTSLTTCTGDSLLFSASSLESKETDPKFSTKSEGHHDTLDGPCSVGPASSRVSSMFLYIWNEKPFRHNY